MTETEAIEVARQTAIEEISWCNTTLNDDEQWFGAGHKQHAGQLLRARIITAGMLLATLRDPQVTLKPLTGSPFGG